MKFHDYNVRIERGRGRLTVRVLAVDAAEARAQAEWQYADAGWAVVSVGRSPYACDLSHRQARREFLAARKAA